MGKFKDLTGKKFGRLSVIERAENKGKKVVWLCKCDCGNYKKVMSCSLSKGATNSCGCLHKEKLYHNKNCMKHGQRHTKLYEVWLSMKQRCENSNSQYYYRYGGRGITVCDEWKDFEPFYEWSISNGYKDGLTIDRKDNDKEYSPNNCRWTDRITQANNTSRNHYLTYNGKTQTVAQWAREIGITHRCLLHRIERGWSVEKALTKR